MTEKQNKLHYANTYSPTIEAIVYQLFSFDKKSDAEHQLTQMRTKFILSKEQVDEESLRLWIKGYDINPHEKEKGYLGNFAVVRVGQKKDKKYTLFAEKDEVEIKLHPQKKRPKKKHPDWGQPILRKIKDNKIICETVEEAREVLLKLHEEYPEVSIPSINKLHIMVYSKAKRQESKGPPVQKIVLLIRAAEDGTFFLDWEENEMKKKKEAPIPKKEMPESAGGEAGVKGRFTSMVELKRNKQAIAPRPGEEGSLSDAAKEQKKQESESSEE
jgi:hypothetical protein